MRTIEKDALLLDRDSVIKVVSALRKYRGACERLLNSRYSDGECDSVSLSDFKIDIDEINDELKNDDL